MSEIRIDPEFHGLIFPPTNEELKELEKSLRAEGCREALSCWNHMILDGHNRYEICRRLNISFKTKNIKLVDRESAKEWIITNQLARRNISLAQRLELVFKREEIIKAKAEIRIKSGKKDPLLNCVEGRPEDNWTDFKLAKMAGCGHSTIHRFRVIEQEGSKELKDKLMKGEVTLNKAYRQLRPVGQKHKSVNLVRKEQTIEKIKELASRGLNASQISNELAINTKYTRFLAKENGIILPDEYISRKRIKVSRIISKTIIAAQSLTVGLDLIDDNRMNGFDLPQINEWIESLSNSIAVLNKLLNQLKREQKNYE